jgi:chemotaxis protein histidine kinase CheA/CheY-like chemotaxis protein
VRISAKALDKIFRAVNELAVGLLRLRTQNDDILNRSNALSALDQVAMQRLVDIEQRVTLKGLGRSVGPASSHGSGATNGEVDPDSPTDPNAGSTYASNAQTAQPIQAGFDALELDRYNELTGATQALTEAMDDMRGARDALVPSLRDVSVLTQRQLDIAREARFQLAQARLRPLSGLRARLRRTVRQTGAAVGRDVALEIAGDDLRVDAAVLAPLSEALLHLLRNCVDHGIEAPQERLAVGKPAQGTIRVAFASLGSGVVITISDDGRGLDHEAILNKALWSGLVPTDAKLSKEEIGRLIFLPGFSTRSAVTETSGRGVGLDAVVQAVASLQGNVGVTSVAGDGTEFRLFVLSSIGTVHALHLEAGGEHFLVPSTQLERVDAAPFLLDLQLDAKPDSQAVATQSLLQLLHGDATGASAMKDLEARPALVINVDGTQRRIAVDRIIEAREFLTSPVPALIDRMSGVSGVATLADGSLGLVLDLIDLSRKPLPVQAQGLQQLAASVQEQAHILVTDDSASVRNTLSALLRDENYRVTTARDGLEAMQILQDSRFSLVLTDLEMPQANGFELTEFIRNRSSQRTLPVVMLTSRGQDKHRERAAAVGVDAFLVKPYSDDGLLKTIRKALAAVPGQGLQNKRVKDNNTQDNADLEARALRAPVTRNMSTTARGFE